MTRIGLAGQLCAQLGRAILSTARPITHSRRVTMLAPSS
jgi:hypothetical protein